MNVEAMSKREIFAAGEEWANFTMENVGPHFVRDEYHDDVSLFRGLGGFEYLEVLFCRLLPRRAAFAQPHPNVHPAVAKIQRMCMALASKSDDGRLFGLQRAQIGILVIKDR